MKQHNHNKKQTSIRTHSSRDQASMRYFVLCPSVQQRKLQEQQIMITPSRPTETSCSHAPPTSRKITSHEQPIKISSNVSKTTVKVQQKSPSSGSSLPSAPVTIKKNSKGNMINFWSSNSLMMILILFSTLLLCSS